MPTPLHEADSFDPLEYAFRVVDPWWLGGLERRVRHALERTGFAVVRILTSPDESMVSFTVSRGQPLAHLETLDAARVALQAALTNADCPCGEQELALSIEGDRWNGAYCPPMPEDYVDPVAYLNALPPYA